MNAQVAYKGVAIKREGEIARAPVLDRLGAGGALRRGVPHRDSVGKIRDWLVSAAMFQAIIQAA